MFSILLIQKTVEYERKLHLEEEERRNHRPEASTRNVEIMPALKQKVQSEQSSRFIRERQTDCQAC